MVICFIVGLSDGQKVVAHKEIDHQKLLGKTLCSF
jgi:hypothetical protein